MIQLPSGCPTSLSKREASLLQFHARGRTVVEAGSLLGGSTIYLAEVASRVFSIDRHLSYTVPTLRRFKSNLLRAGIADKVDVIVECALSALPRYPADFGFIDLTGQYRITKLALEAIQAPIVGVHDVGRAYCSGVSEAIKMTNFEVIEQVDTLAILRKR